MNPAKVQPAIMQNFRSDARTMGTSGEAGAILVISLIMLILMTLLAVSVFNLGKGDFQVIGNAQRQNEALVAAQETIEAAISTTRLFESPANIFPAPCAGANTKCVDSNGDGQMDVTVTLTPTPSCVKAATVKSVALNLSNAEDVGCAVSAAQSFGVAGAATGDSLCADSLWEVAAVAVDTQAQATVTVTQGVAVRVSTDNIATSCP